MRLKEKVARLEEARRRRKGAEPYTVQADDGRVEARVAPLSGRPPAVTIRYDSLTLTSEKALEAVRDKLPPAATLYLFPKELDDDAWDAAARAEGWLPDKTETPTLH